MLVNRTLVVAASITLAAVAAGPTQAHAHAPLSPTNVRVSRDRFVGHAEPSLAVNPGNPRNLVGVAQFITTGQTRLPGAFVSFDDGATWQDNGLLPLPPGYNQGVDTTVAFTTHGLAFIAASALHVIESGGSPQVSRSGVVVWRSDDGGRSFTRPVVVFQSSAVQDHPWLAVDTTDGPGHGTLYVAWATDTGLVVSRSSDNGHSFSAPRTISSAADGHPTDAVATVGAGGTVQVAYEARHTAGVVLEVAVSSDHGRRFGYPHIVTVLADPTLQVGQAPLLAAAADPRGHSLYVVLAAPDQRTAHTEIRLWRSRDDGHTWAAPAPVAPEPRARGADQGEPQLVVAADGAVYVSYFALARGRIDVFLARSTTHGASFGPSRRITGVSSRVGGWLGDYQGLAAGPATIYPFWNDWRTGRLEIYTAAVNLSVV